MTNETDDNDDFDSSAADEPTAMWGADALRDLGLEAAAKDHDEPTPVVTLPPRQVRPALAAGKPGGRPKTVPKKRAQAIAGGPSWTMTIALAIAVAALVFFGVRAILG